MAQLKDDKKKKTIKKGTKKTTTKPKAVKEIIKDNYEEIDKAAAVKKEMKKADSPKMKIIMQNRKTIIAFVVGLVIGLLVMNFFIPDRIATLEDGEQVIAEVGDSNITSNQLYEDMKDDYSVNMLINKIDTMILSNLYPEDDDMKKSVEDTASYYISMYQTYYGYTEDQFLSANGFKSHDAFLTYLTLDYQRNEYYKEYVKSLITDKEIKAYYKTDAYGDISTKYISIDSSSDADSAKALADEIIGKLNDGVSYDDVISKYKSKIKYEDLGYVSFDNSLDDTYVDALKELENNTYTTEAVKSDSDYKIIFRGDQKDKASLDDCRDKIIDVLVTEKETNDTTLYYKALDHMRKENNVSIKDTDLLKRYNDYIKENTTTDTSTDSSSTDTSSTLTTNTTN